MSWGPLLGVLLVLLALGAVVGVLLRRRGSDLAGSTEVAAPRGHARGERGPAVGSFSDLVGRRELLKGIERMGWTSPTAAQLRIAPLIRAGKDVIAVATSGTGKTGAYLLPLLDVQAGREGLGILILCARANEVRKVSRIARRVTDETQLWIGEVHDEAPLDAQVRDLRAGYDVLIATPDRLSEHLSRGNVALGEVNTVVLHDADRLLETRRDATVRILDQTRQRRQIVALIGRDSEAVRDELRRFSRNAEWVDTTPTAARRGAAPADRAARERAQP
ncbi:MAG: DEAD/DEAH box helicase, partial [Longimicrobiales bacterium]